MSQDANQLSRQVGIFKNEGGKLVFILLVRNDANGNKLGAVVGELANALVEVSFLVQAQ